RERTAQLCRDRLIGNHVRHCFRVPCQTRQPFAKRFYLALSLITHGKLPSKSRQKSPRFSRAFLRTPGSTWGPRARSAQNPPGIAEEDVFDVPLRKARFSQSLTEATKAGSVGKLGHCDDSAFEVRTNRDGFGSTH